MYFEHTAPPWGDLHFVVGSLEHFNRPKGRVSLSEILIQLVSSIFMLSEHRRCEHSVFGVSINGLVDYDKFLIFCLKLY